MIKENIHTNFKSLQFEPVKHVYTLNEKSLSPVSNVVSRFSEEFDTQTIAERYAIKHGRTREDVIQEWENISKQACDFGSRVHDFGERYFYNRELKPSNPHEQAIVKFWNDLPEKYEPVACETRIYTEDYEYAGTFDFLLLNKNTGKCVICDYKTNKDLHKNFAGKTMLAPFQYLLDTPFNHYQLQLSLYQIPLEDIGVIIEDRWVIWLKPDGDYLKIDTYDFSKHLRNVLC